MSKQVLTVKITEADLDNYAVEQLAQKMKEKLARKRAEGYGGWLTCDPEHLSKLLREHVDKGDPVDVANFTAFLSFRGLGILGLQETPKLNLDPATTRHVNSLVDDVLGE